MSRKKFNQDQFVWTLKGLREDLNRSNNLKSRELKENKEIAEKELDVKDRVDLSLKEYKELQDKIAVLESNNDFLQGVFKDLKLKDYLSNIDFNTINIRTYRDDLRCKHKIVISFDLEVFE